MTEITKQYLMLKFGWDYVVVPTDKGLQLLGILSECTALVSTWEDNKQIFKIKHDKQEISVRFLTEADYLAMHIEGGEA